MMLLWASPRFVYVFMNIIILFKAGNAQSQMDTTDEKEKAMASSNEYMETTRLLAHLTKLQDQLDKQQYQIDEQRNNAQKLQNQVDEQRNNAQKLQNQVDGLKDELDTINAEKQDFASGFVAFHANIAGFTGSPTERTTIPFDIVNLNIGNAYNPNTGAFTAPVSGIYALGYEVLADGSCGTTYTQVHLLINGASASTSCSEVYSSGGTSTAQQLAAGDTVELAVDGGSICEVLFSGSTWQTFSGHLLYQIL